MTIRCRLLPALAAFLIGACSVQPRVAPDPVVISVVGTNDVHGELLPGADRGGLVGLSGFVEALRRKRVEDGGAVLLIDAGDMWQGTLESNLDEGATVVEIYSQMGFAAAAIGNHEFDFGPAGPAAMPQQPGDDPRGALKRRIADARFPVLAANLIDDATGLPVDWKNVQPSVLVDVGGVRVAIVGVMTLEALETTIAANVDGLSVAPLAETIERESRQLRARGADLVIVSAHAGSRCNEFDDPLDLSSCDMDGEIMRVVAALPPGLVDHVIAGHVHRGIAHIVNGTAVTSSFSSTRAFSRVDFVVDRRSGEITGRRVFPPQQACLWVMRDDDSCAPADADQAQVTTAIYEGVEVRPARDVVAIAEEAAAAAQALRREPLGAFLDAPFPAPDSPEAPLARLFTDALLETSQADIALHNVMGGIRAGLPPGELTFGDVYKMFPFDNRAVVIELSAAELATIVAEQARNPHRRAGFSGMRAFVRCVDGRMDVEMRLDDGRAVEDHDRVRVLTNDFLALGGDGILTPVIPRGGFPIGSDLPQTRDLLTRWFASRAQSLHPDDFDADGQPAWNIGEMPAGCVH